MERERVQELSGLTPGALNPQVDPRELRLPQARNKTHSPKESCTHHVCMYIYIYLYLYIYLFIYLLFKFSIYLYILALQNPEKGLL